jgi:hypothetical protein
MLVANIAAHSRVSSTSTVNMFTPMGRTRQGQFRSTQQAATGKPLLGAHPAIRAFGDETI